ncbi:ATP-binding protein [Candidatus Sumerlaeota bacterium]|nr:ATP-binding protein [Candidatus Sumerlaeota bacterium]
MAEWTEISPEQMKEVLEAKFENLIPRRLRHMRFSNFIAPQRSKLAQVVQTIKNWRPQDGKQGRPRGSKTMLLILGEPGTGKTHLSIALIYELIMQQEVHFIKWVTAENIASEYAFSFRDDSDMSPADIEDSLKQIEFLCIDDLGYEHLSEASVGLFHRIFCYRYDWMLPTIVTTNLELEEIANRYGYRVLSRFFEMATIVHIPTKKDFRVKRAKVNIFVGK